jgi:tRNA(Ile)-lysidine synthase
MAFQPTEVLTQLHSLAATGRWLVAYSGGLDSTVLLHCLASQLSGAERGRLAAIHINHGLQAQAASWQQHCKASCSALGVEFVAIPVEVDRHQASLEEAARKARYRAFSKQVAAGDCLLFAHHADDQLETMLLRLVRGSGLEAWPVCL